MSTNYWEILKLFFRWLQTCSKNWGTGSSQKPSANFQVCTSRWSQRHPLLLPASMKVSKPWPITCPGGRISQWDVVISIFNAVLLYSSLTSRCNPWFVRCIRPNNHKAAMTFDQDVVQQQLQYTGMMETIRIRKMGYPVRYRFHTFANRWEFGNVSNQVLPQSILLLCLINRYFVLLKSRQRRSADGRHDDHAVCSMVLKSLPSKWSNAWQLGITKVGCQCTLSVMATWNPYALLLNHLPSCSSRRP